MSDAALELPAGLELARTTPEFDENSVPEGLRRAHHVADAVWGRLVVAAGSVRFVFEDGPDGSPEESGRVVNAGESQVIPPHRRHHVETIGPVSFHVEFHRTPRSGDGATPGG